MFEVGEIVVCVDVKVHIYNDFQKNRRTRPKAPKNITLGKQYDVVGCDKHHTFIINDSGVRKCYRTDRFKSLTKDRRTKIEKIRNKINQCSE